MKKILSIALKTLAALAAALGVGLLLGDADDAADAAATLSYFTTQSNLAIAVLFSVLIVRELKGKTASGRTLAVVRLAATVAIVLTGVVFNLMLRPFFTGSEGYDPNTFRDFLVHVAVPLLALADFLVFYPRGILRMRDVGWTLAGPAAYWLYVLAFAAFGGRFEGSPVPYFFMNVTAYGPWYALLVAAFVLLLGQALIGFDRLLVRKEESL